MTEPENKPDPQPKPKPKPKPKPNAKRLDRDLMRGAGPTAVLQILSVGEMYGYELVEQLARRTDGVLAMGQGTLYPMLYNLEAKGLVKAETRTAANGRDRRYYTLTGKGKKKLAAERERWSELTAAMGKLGVVTRAALGDAPPEGGAA